ncbi:M23 family metallopeptidase [Phenylobacterium sp.]|uniref:M23 family metallopeptidase n=1 Tax=Phenylobacterium sp. TaxID=1871053 RepID=UPI00286B93DD|nr:M23 family metallopeptidase [Phenylobacterium sp.]
MNLTFLAAFGRLRHISIEAALVAGLTLSAVTAAYAAADDLAPQRVEANPRVVAATAAVPVDPPPPPLLEVGEPVPGYPINSPFGLRRMPWEKHGRLHEGVDIAAPVGVPVVSVADGVITQTGNSPSYGRFVEVKHAEGLVSFYAHLGRIDPRAKPGVAVLGGRTIGKIGSSGTSTGPHVHFEIRQDDRPLNPVAFIGRDFATAQDLPLQTAARYSRRVRVAQVSFIPQSKRKLMEVPVEASKLAKGERPRATLKFAPRTADEAAVDVSATVTSDIAVSGPPAIPTVG